MNNNFNGENIENVTCIKTLVATTLGEQYVKKQTMVKFNEYKQNGTKSGAASAVYSPIKGEVSFDKSKTLRF